MTLKKLLFPIILLLSAPFCYGQYVSTLAGTGVQGWGGTDSLATDIAVKLNTPHQIAVDTLGNIYFADKNNYVVRKVDTAGRLRTIAGNNTLGSSGDGAAATSAQLAGPVGVAADRAGNIYISDFVSHTIRKVNASGIITTICGTAGTAGSTGDGGPATAALLYFPMHIALDTSGHNLYIADTTSIRKINLLNDTIYRVVGMGPLDTAGFYGDGGQATNALLNRPTSVYVDAANNLYISDGYNNAVRKVNPSGIITTIAGNPALGYLGAGYTGDGNHATNAQFNYPMDIAMDAVGNIYIADVNNDAIRMINVFGFISTVVGSHVRGFNGDNKLATVTQIYAPTSVRIYKGTLYFSDSGNARVRRMNIVPNLVPEVAKAGSQIYLWPNPNSGSFVISGQANTQWSTATVKVEDVTGKVLYSVPVSVTNGIFKQQVNLDKELPAGLYFVKLISEADHAAVRFIKQ